MHPIKSIPLNIQEHLEADFYLSLYKLKQSEQIEPTVKILLNSISFDTTITNDFVLVNRPEIKTAYLQLKIAWDIFQEQDQKCVKYHDIILTGFKAFRKSALGKRIMQLYLLIFKFQKHLEHMDDPNFKAGVAYLALAWTNAMKNGEDQNLYYRKIMKVISDLPKTKKEIEIRTKTVELIHEAVEQFFTSHSDHFKRTVTGYFCVPLDVVLSKNKYFEKKTGYLYYAEYVRNVVKNALNRK